MAYSKDLEHRIDHSLRGKNILFHSKKMMGGLCYMIDDKMCIGIIGEKLMCRIDPLMYEACLTKEGCHEMDFTGKVMKGYVIIEPGVLERDEELSYWIGLCLDFNPRAKSSKKKNT